MLSALAAPSFYNGKSGFGLGRFEVDGKNVTYEELSDYDPLVDGKRRRKIQNVRCSRETDNGGLEKYRQKSETATSSGEKGFRSQKSKVEAFVSRSPEADVRRTRCQRVAQVRTQTADGWAVSMSTVTTQSFQVTQVFGNVSPISGNRTKQETIPSSRPKIIEMDLDTVEGISNLDHTHQKVRSELAQRGSLGQRRPPTRAGIRAFASAVWEQDQEENYSTVSSEDGILVGKSPNVSFPKSSDCRDEPEGKEDEKQPIEEMSEDDKPSRGWKQPPKHAVLVFPMQLLNSNKFKETETVIRESETSHKNILIEEPASIKSESTIDNISNKNTTTTVKITQESETESMSSSEEEIVIKSKSQKRLSAPTIVSITLKEPTVIKNSKSVESLVFDEPIKPTINPMVITIGDMRTKSYENRTHLESFQSSNKSDHNVYSENPNFTKEPLIVEEDCRRNMGVQVRIKNRKSVPVSPTRERRKETQVFDKDNNSYEETRQWSPVSKSTPFFHGSGGVDSIYPSTDFNHQHQGGNTVVFIKPTPTSPIAARRSQASNLSPDRSTVSSRLKWNKSKNVNENEEETKENNFNLHEQGQSSNRDGRSSASSIDRNSTASRESFKDDSPERLSKKNDRQQQRVQIQTWDRRTQDAKSPSPSRSRIRQLVMSRGKSVSPLRPASVIGDDGETERSGRKETVEVSGFSSRRSSPTGHRSTSSRPVLSENINKPEWLKKIDLNRRKVIDWENLGALRKCSESESVSPTRFEKISDRLERCSDIIDRSPTRYSEDIQPPGRTWERSHSDSFLLEEEELREVSSRMSGSENIKNQEPEWIRIAEMRRRSSINWEEIAAIRKAEAASKEAKPVIVVEDDLSESHNVGVQVNFRRPEAKKRSETKERRSSPSRKSVSSSKIPRSSQQGDEVPKSEANVIQNILSKVRASQEVRGNEGSRAQVKDEAWSTPRSPSPWRQSNTESKMKLKEEPWSSPRSPSPWRQNAAPLYRWPDTEKEIVIEELPKAAVAAKERNERIRSPSPTGPAIQQDKPPLRPRESREHRKERPRSMVELGRQSPKRRSSPPIIPRSPPPRSSGQEPQWKISSRSGRASRRQSSPDEQGLIRGQSRIKITENRRRSSSYDKLSSMSSGSEHEGEDKSGESDVPANKKKVRFLINRENGLQLERPETDTTFTMFGMDKPTGNNKRNNAKNETGAFEEVDLNRNSSFPRPGTPISESAKTDSTSFLNEDDYQLQAYKIINHIKQLSKEPVTQNRSPQISRESSPIRVECNRQSSPETPRHQSYFESNRPRQKENSTRHVSSATRRSSKGTKTKDVFDLRRRDVSPISSDSGPKEGTQSSEPVVIKTPGGRTPEWMKKALHKQKSPVDWESLERGANTESNKPLWAGVKLKKTPYSTKFLAESSDIESVDDGTYPYGSECDGVAPYEQGFDYRDYQQLNHQGAISVEELGDNEEVSLHVEKRRLRVEKDEELSSSPVASGENSPIAVRKESGSASRNVRNQELNNCYVNNKKIDCSMTVLDSEGYSSMESCFSGKTPSCKHCGRFQEENSSSNSSSLCNDIIEESEKVETINVTLKNKSQPDDSEEWDTCCRANKFETNNQTEKGNWFSEENNQYSEPCLPAPPPLSVSLAMDPNSPQEYDNQMYQTIDYYQREPKVNKPRRSVSMRVVNSNHHHQELSAAGNEILYGEEDVKGKQQHCVPVRRNSLSETRQKLIDILTTKSTKRGPQIKTIRKTIRRILRGTEVTDEEEEIVEEITEEVFGIPPEKTSKNHNGGKTKTLKGQSTITRTVHQTKDGRKFLTTTILDGGLRDDSSSSSSHPEIQRNNIRVKRLQSEGTM